MRSSARDMWLAGVLAVGFISLFVATIAAHGDPATGYELSIYESTTPVFWIAASVAIVAALVTAFQTGVSWPLRGGAIALATGAVLSIVSLPLIRGYYFYGSADSLSHLGWTRMMAGEIPGATMSPTELLYPGIHSTGVAIAGLTGVPLTRSLLFVVSIYTLLFFVFVPICVRALVEDDLAVAVGAFSGLLLLPINNVSVFNLPYPTGQAIYLLPLLIFLVIVFVLPGGSSRSALRWGVLLAVVSLAVLLVHPLIAGPALLVLAAIAGIQFVYRRWRPGHPIAGHRRLHANVAFFGLAFLLWSQRFPRVQQQEVILMESLLFGGQPIGDEVATRAGSLAVLGTSIAELYVKIFLVATVFAALAALVGLASLFGRLDEDVTERSALVKYLTVATVPVVGTFLVFYAASLSVLPFRILGTVMVLVTILGAVAIADGLPFRPSRPKAATVRRAVVIVLFVALTLQMAHVHSSPYIYRASSQVSEQEYVGHEIAFEHRDPDVAWAGPRDGPHRYLDAIYGTSFNDTTPGGAVFSGAEAMVPIDVFGNNMTDYYGGDRYVGVSEGTVEKEVGLYDGFRYSREQFANMETAPGIHRVQSNGEFWLYYVNGSA